MIPEHRSGLDRRLSVAFDLRIPEQAEAQHASRATCARETTLEAVNKDLLVLHVRSGSCRCGEDEAA